MLTLYILIFYFTTAKCENLMHLNTPNNDNLIKCISKILEEYFSESKEVTCVDINYDDNEIIKAVHSLNKVTLISRKTDQSLVAPNEGYLIMAQDALDFTEHFYRLIQEPKWNPYARFLTIIRDLEDDELVKIFTVFLRVHVNNVLLINGTEDAHLYSYNPFENNACGRYFDRVINYGQCCDTTQDLYSNNVVNSLANCTFSVTVPHRPPYALDINQIETGEATMGAEQHIFKELAEIEQFNVQFKYNYGQLDFTKIYPNMSAVGPMAGLQNNETDIILGGIIATMARKSAFTFLSGHAEYVDGFAYVVKKATPVAIWKDVYLEFDEHVWLLLTLALLIYSVIMMIFLETKDKSAVMLKMFDNLLQHGYYFRSGMMVKFIFIIWVWFAYLMNTFYQSNLMSITTNPVKEYQISSGNDIIRLQMKVCLGLGVRSFISYENPDLNLTLNLIKCVDMYDSVKKVAKSRHLFTLVTTSFFDYNNMLFYDEWGRPLTYRFKERYSELIFGIYFYKGFPISDRLRMNAIRMRENGLMQKRLSDQYHARKIKCHFRNKDYEARFAVPWLVYGVGCLISSAIFILEVCFNAKK